MLRLHIGSRTLKFHDRAPPRRLVFRDTDFLTVERLGPMQSLTPEGFLVIRNVPLARTGPQLYSDQEIPIQGDARGRIIIARDAEEVFRPSTLNSLNGKAVTLDHPDDDVTPENFKALLVGTVINPRRGMHALDNLLLGDLIIYDPVAIKAIRGGDVREVSVGYKADYEETGVGHGRQRNIICNHLALVQDGRCGPMCRIGDKAFYPRHEEDCGCAACTHDAAEEMVTEATTEALSEALVKAVKELAARVNPLNPKGDKSEGLISPLPNSDELDSDLAELAKDAPPSILEALKMEHAARRQEKLPAQPVEEDIETDTTDAVFPVPLDNDLLKLAENAKQSNIIQQIYAEQVRRNRYRSSVVGGTRDSKRTGRRIHLHVRRN